MTRKKNFLYIFSLAIILTSLVSLTNITRIGPKLVQAFAPTTNVGGPITTDTTWDLAGSPYVMTSSVTVEPGVTLTIEPGVTVQGVNGRLLIIEGDLQAVGTSAQPIHFTSSTNTGPYQWNGIAIDGGTGTLEHITLRYAGSFTNAYSYNTLTIRDSSGAVTLQNAEIYDNDALSIWIHKTVLIENSLVSISDSSFHDNGASSGQDAALQIVSGTVTVDNTTFRDNGGSGMLARGTITVTNTTFENHGYLGLRLEPDDWARADNLTFINDPAGLTGGTMIEDTVFPTAWGADHYRLIETVTVAPTATLTIEPGNEIRGQVGAMLIVEGDLQAIGTPTQPITFTSSTNTGPDQWNGIAIDGGSATFNHVRLRYAGGFANEYSRNALTIRDSLEGVTLQNAEIYDNDGQSTFVHRTVYIENSLATIADSNFHDNGADQYSDAALQAAVDSIVSVENTTFLENGGHGLLTSGTSTVTVSTSSFSANDSTGINAFGVITITDSTLENHSGVGMNLTTDQASVTCTNFLNNAEGMRINSSVDPFFLGGSTFSGNTSFAVNNQSGATIDAKYNYWGDPSGPSGNGPGTGDEVSTFVLYDPWLTTSECTVQLTGLNATNDGPTIESLVTQLSASVATGSGVTYSWDFGDGDNATGQNVLHVYPAAGSYLATVVASNSINTLTATTQVEVLPRPSFGGVVWDDQDGDGVQGPGEPGLSGATVTADGPPGTLQDTSAADGTYDIETITEGWYDLSADLAGYEPTTPNPVTLPLPENGSGQVNFGLILSTPPGQGRIAGRAFIDANGNGQFENGETSVNGLLVSLMSGGLTVDTTNTTPDGLYSFENLAAGVYEVQAPSPMGAFPDLLIASDLLVVAGETSFANLSFVFGGSVTGSVTDVDENPLDGVLLSLEQPAGSVIETVITNEAGFYQLSLFSPGTYFLRITPPAGTTPADGQLLREIIIPSDGAAVENWVLDTLGSLTVRVRSWFSPNYIPIAGVDVRIESSGGFSTIETTDFEGKIIQTQLTPDLYTVTPITDTLPDGSVLNQSYRTVNVDLNTAATTNFIVELARSISYYCERNTSTSPPYGPDFPCSVEARVVADDLGTPPGTLVASADLPSGGLGVFADLPTGTYEVSIEPDHTIDGQENWPDHSEIVALNAGTHTEVQYPFNPNYATTSIWGYAFWDKNGDGERQHWTGAYQTNDEANLSASNGLTVELYDENGALLSTAVTQQHPLYHAGWFEFTDLSEGTYQIKVLLPAGFNPASLTTLFREIDFTGYVPPAHFAYNRTAGADVYGRVYFDNDADGHYNVDVDDPYGGITVTLKSSTGAVLETAATSSIGTYSFSDQLTGEYLVELNGPFSGTSPAILEQPVSLPAGNTNAVIDFPLVPLDRKHRVLVFIDEDLDGLPDTNEQRIGDIKIRRYASTCQSGLPGTFEVALTASSGLATFPDSLLTASCAIAGVTDEAFPPGVQPADPLGVALPSNSSVPVWLRLVPPGTLTVQPYWDIDGDLVKDPDEPIQSGTYVTVVGEGSAYSSHLGASFNLSEGAYEATVSPPGGMTLSVTQPFQASVNVNNTSLLEVPMKYTGVIAGQVQSLGESATFGGLTVELLVPTTGDTRTAQVSSANNTFLFTNLPSATYHLRVQEVPPGYSLDGVPVIPYTSGSSVVQNLTLVPLGDVFGKVYLDSNGNGNRNTGEPGTDNYEIYLIDNLDSPPEQVDVAANGDFLIPDLQSGRLYALTTDLDYPGYGPPGAAITEAPGWFSVDNQNLEVDLGILPWDESSGFNVVLGKVYTQNGSTQQSIGGAEVGHFLWDDTTGCNAASPSILGTTYSDVNGNYRMDTTFLPGTNYYCLKVLDAPGFTPANFQVVPTNMTYQTSSGPVVQSRIDAGKDLQVNPLGGSAQNLTMDESTLYFAAFIDANFNSIWDPGEQPLLGAGLDTATSGVDGSGILSGLADGEHTLAITAPAGYTPSGPDTRTVFLNGADLTLPPLPFRLAGALSGSVFIDFDGDGLQGAGGQERGLDGVSINLSGPSSAGTTSSPNGSFLFLDLPDGTYTLSVVTPPGFENVPDRIVTVSDGGAAAVPLKPLGQVSGAVYEDWDGDSYRGPDESLASTPITLTLEGVDTTRLFGGHLLYFDAPNGTYTLTPGWSAVEPVQITLNASNAAAVALPAVDPGAVRGTVWHDTNRDGHRQPWEAPLSGILVTLDGGDSAITDEDGQFIFLGAADGSHTLTADLPEGLEANLSGFTTGGGRGAAVGVAAAAPAEVVLYLPMIIR